MKKSFLMMLGALVFTGFLSSCGGSGNEEKVANLENGKAVYNKACIACHWKGVAGAAPLSDKARWEEIAAKGMKTLTNHALTGVTGKYGVMPEKGTCVDCTEDDLFDAISYMMHEAGVTPAKEN